MLLRKLNSVLSLLITLLLMDHAIFMAVWMLSQGGVAQNANSMPRILFVLMMVHAIISILLAVVAHKKGAEKHKGNSYSKLNVQTNIQRVSGILLIVFTVLHVLGAVGIMTPPQVVHAILPPLFFALCLAHVSVSASKALITLGVGNAKIVRSIDVAVKTLCAVTLIADVVGFYLYVV